MKNVEAALRTVIPTLQEKYHLPLKPVIRINENNNNVVFRCGEIIVKFSTNPENLAREYEVLHALKNYPELSIPLPIYYHTITVNNCHYYVLIIKN